MRQPKYLSPTSLGMWMQNRRDFYIQYLAENRVPRPPQTTPMAVGSAFDAYVKSFIVQRLNGSVDPAFEFNTIFEAQVEAQNRDVARRDGKYVFDFYQACGALSDIILDLEGAVGKPRFETAIEGFVTGVSGEFGDVPFLGKPDIYFLTKKGARVIFDWKVNGFYSNYNISPKPGYVRLRCYGPDSGKSHAKAMVMEVDGLKIAATHPLCSVDKTWAAQLSIYAWLLGQEVGSKFIVAIDQIACSRDGAGNRVLRVAQHRSQVTEAFQKEVYGNAHKAWYAIQSGHIFDHLSRADSDAQCELIESMLVQKPLTGDDFEDVCR